MTWAAAAVGGASLLGGVLGSSSQKRAAQTQAEAAKAASQASLQGTRESNQLVSDIYRQGMATQAPNIYGGNVALSALMSGMGLGQARNRAINPLGQSGDVGGAGSPAGPGSFYNSAGVAVDAQGNPVAAGSGLGNINYGATDAEMASAASPYEGVFTDQFTPSDLTTDPSYQWRLNEGTRNLRAQQAAGGNRWGGQAMKDIIDYSGGSASQEFSSAQARYRQRQQDLYNQLTGIVSGGAQAGANAQSAGANAANTMSSNTMQGINSSNQALMGGANASAAGQVGATNALVGGLNTGLNNWYTMQYLNPNSQQKALPSTTQTGPANYSMWGGNPRVFGQP